MCGREKRVSVSLNLEAVTQALDSCWGVFVFVCVRQHTRAYAAL